MQKFDSIRPFYDAEVNAAICASLNHPMLKAIMNFTFPDVADDVWKEQLRKCCKNHPKVCQLQVLKN